MCLTDLFHLGWLFTLRLLLKVLRKKSRWSAGSSLKGVEMQMKFAFCLQTFGSSRPNDHIFHEEDIFEVDSIWEFSHLLLSTAIQQVARMTTVATLMYASPAWWGYTQASDRARMEQLLSKLKRYGFLPPQCSNCAANGSHGRWFSLQGRHYKWKPCS